MGHILCKTDPEPIWMAWPGFGYTHLVWKQAGVKKIIGPSFWQDATSPLPVDQFQTRLRSSTDVPDNIMQNQTGSDLALADCVRFWPNGSGPEASRCARIIQPASGQCFPADPDRILYREHASELSSPGSQHKLPQHFYCWKMATNGTDLMGYDSNSHFAFQLVKK